VGTVPDVHPGLLLLIGSVLVAVVPRRWGNVASVLLGALALGAVLRLSDGDTMHLSFYGMDLTMLRADSLSLPFATVFAVVTIVFSIYGWGTMGPVERASALATAGCGIGVVLAGDLFTLFFFWEIKVLTAVVLILAGRAPGSRPAGVRYLAVHLVGGSLLLAGAVWHIADNGSMAFDGLGTGAAAWLMLAAFLVSAAVPPFNAWLPDAYPASTVVGTVFLSAFTTKSAVYALLRGFPGLEVLVWLGVVMALYGVVQALLADDIRRLLCYHIVSQVGFMVAAVGAGTSEAVNGATAHAYAHVLYKGLLLMGVGAVLYAVGRSRASELGGLARAQPRVVLLYLVGALSISGFPLFSGFAAKELAMASVGDAGFGLATWLLKLASIGTFLSVALKLPAMTWFGTARGPVDVKPIPVGMYLAMGILAAANIAIGIFPGLLYDQMPNPVAFEPYTAAKVVESLQLFLFAGIGYWLLRTRLAPTAKVALDTDWVYRELPAGLAPRVATAFSRLREAPVPTLRSVLGGFVEPTPARSAVGAGWVLGVAIAATTVVVLASNLVP
jgi:multicomponent Na+:H+ antiporter subunit D